jgi:hypothetical protein
MSMLALSALAANDIFDIGNSVADQTGSTVQSWAFPAGVIAAAFTLFTGKFSILRAFLALVIGGLAYFAVHDYDALVPVLETTWANLTGRGNG